MRNIKGKKFDVPDRQAYCEKCGTTNYIYSGMKAPFKCDCCGSPLDETVITEADLEDGKYAYEEGRYDGEI